MTAPDSELQRAAVTVSCIYIHITYIHIYLESRTSSMAPMTAPAPELQRAAVTVSCTAGVRVPPPYSSTEPRLVRPSVASTCKQKGRNNTNEMS